MRVNIGCGQTPIQGWNNFDNSISVRLAKFWKLIEFMKYLNLLDQNQLEFIKFAHKNKIEYGNVVEGLPLSNNSVEVLYSSHMLEHLDQNEVLLFFREAKRILNQNGIIRLAVPDIRIQINKYLKCMDADQFVKDTLLTQPRPKSFFDKLRVLFVGARNHQWMYDGKSLSMLLYKQGFKDITIVNAGHTRISNPMNLNLFERSEESVYVEAIYPGN